MLSIQLPLLLLCLTLSGVCLNGGQPLPEASENMGRRPLDNILQRSESFILQSVLKKAEKKEEMNKGICNTGYIPLVMLVYFLAEIIRPNVFTSQILMHIFITPTKAKGGIAHLL